MAFARASTIVSMKAKFFIMLRETNKKNKASCIPKSTSIERAFDPPAEETNLKVYIKKLILTHASHDVLKK
jgi:hypothetical protein